MARMYYQLDFLKASALSDEYVPKIPPKQGFNGEPDGKRKSVSGRIERTRKGYTYGRVQNGANRVEIRPEEEELTNLPHDFCKTKGDDDISLASR